MSIDNGEVKYYQPRFAKWIQSAKWDSIAERLSETSMSLITQVMNAEKMETVVGLYGMNVIMFLRALEKLQIGQTEIIKRCLLRYRFILLFIYVMVYYNI